MKRFLFLIGVTLSSLPMSAQCNDQLIAVANQKLDSYVYVRDFKIELKEAKKKKDKKSFTYTVILNKEIKYRFILEDAKEFEGRLVFELIGSKGKIMSSYNEKTKKHYKVLEYSCKRSGVHYINLGFSETKEGCGVLVYSFKKADAGDLSQQ